MILSLYSFWMAVFFSTFFVLTIHFLRNSPFFLRSLGGYALLAMCGLCFFRMAFGLEMSFTVPIGIRGAFSHVSVRIQEIEVPVGRSVIGVADLFCLIWLVVAGILIVQFVCRDYRARKELAAYSHNRSLLAGQVLERVKRDAPRRFSVDVYVCRDIDIPLSLGLFRKRIFIPDEAYTKEELYYILKHEYTHFCYYDWAVKLFTKLFCCAFWWNPAAYLLKRDVGEILEIRCDQCATRNFTKKERVEYLLTILRILKGEPLPRASSFLAVGFLFRKNNDEIKERFKLLTMAAKPVNRRLQALVLGLAVLVTVLSYTFVFQPASDPPSEDIYTDSSVREVQPDEYVVYEFEDGTYAILLDTGEVFPTTKEVAEFFLSDGIEYRKESGA